MKPRDPNGFHRPFERLSALIGSKTLPAAPAPPSPATAPPLPLPPSEQELFAEAMQGVRPLEAQVLPARRPGPPPVAPGSAPDAGEMNRLARLVACGEGFVVADTPEYMEGAGCLAPPGITRRLHRGDFALQGHVDLHGLNAEQAQTVFEAFIRQSLAAGRRALLVIHGRGLSSPSDPVLKSKLKEWLTRGPWRKWVIAFTSARACDGGAGATYLLLRRRPLTKRHRRNRPPQGLRGPTGC
ncbi:MAG: Smr/MutS family endonuclease [Desulfobacterales bacterium]|nr:Smr/MutS family endonuclease [Desulfobacterales bacterium]